MNVFKFPRSVTINVLCTGAKQLNIGQQSIIDGKKILAIVTSVVVGPTTKTSNGADPCRLQEGAYLRLVNGKNEIIHDAVSLVLLDPRYSAGLQVFELNTQGVDWTKSTIFFGNAQDATDSKDKEIPLMVIYE